MKPIAILMLVLIITSTGCLMGHAQSKMDVLPEHYKLWHQLKHQDISAHGNWVTYTLGYDEGPDTLFVKHVHKSTTLAFEEGYQAKISDNEQWLMVHQNDTVVITNLKNGSQTPYPKVVEAQFMSKGNYAVFRKQTEITSQLILLNLVTNKTVALEDIKEHQLDDNGQHLAFIQTNNAVGLIIPEQDFKTVPILGANNANRKHVVWNRQGSALALFEELPTGVKDSINHKIWLIDEVLGTQKTKSLDPTEKDNVVYGQAINFNLTFTPLHFSEDNQRLLFYFSGHTPSNKAPKLVEIWNSASKLEYNREKIEGNPQQFPKLASWNLGENKIIKVTTNEHFKALLPPRQNFALVFDPHQFEPQYDLVGKTDLYLIDLNTGVKKLIIQEQSQKIYRLNFSPNGTFINYFKDQSWWVYNTLTDKHHLVSKKMGQLYYMGYAAGEHPPYGSPGWSNDSKYLILHDKYNVWLVTPDGKTQLKLTNGEVDQTVYRIPVKQTKLKTPVKFYDIGNYSYDLSQDLIIESTNLIDKSGSYLTWQPKAGLKTIVKEDAKFLQLKKTTLNKAYLFTSQRADVPHQLRFIDGKGRVKTILQTNKHHFKFNWGKTELLSYKNHQGQALKAVLRYPVNYDPTKQYPLVVHIYEEQSYLFHNYFNPSHFNFGGFNPSLYTNDGYFVLHPDIVYTPGEPGFSAVECVEAAIDKVTESEKINLSRIGLIGASFGGYETSFIITQSNKFAAAVAGTAITDFVGNTLILEKDLRIRMWRGVTHQYRMGQLLYDDYEGYLQNSPIFHAKNINTPLLSYVGLKDRQVEPEESMKLHLALRSLNKPAILLRYPRMGHVVVDSEIQKDLTLKIKNWFDHYLKDLPLSNELKTY